MCSICISFFARATVQHHCHLSLSRCPLLFHHFWCGSSHFLAVTSSAFTLTRDTHDKLGVEVKVMGCESNAPAPHYTHCTCTRRKPATQTHGYRSCVYAISHTIPSATQSCPETKQKVVLQMGWWPGCYITQREKNRKRKFWLTSTPTLTPTCVFLPPHLFKPQHYSIIYNMALLSTNIFTHHSVFPHITKARFRKCVSFPPFEVYFQLMWNR